VNYAELTEFRKVRNETLRLTAALSPAQLDYRPTPNRWSVGEVLDHLYLFDELFGQEIRELIELRKAGKAAIVLRSFADYGLTFPYVPKVFMPLFEIPVACINIFVPRSVRGAFFRWRQVPAQSPEITQPRRGRPAEELRRELDGFPESIAHLTSQNPDIDLRQLTFYQGLLGFSNVARILEVLANHERRHQGQVRDLLADPGFPF